MKPSSGLKYHMNLIAEALLFPILKLGLIIAFVFFFAYRILPESIHSIVKLSCITVMVVHVGFNIYVYCECIKKPIISEFLGYTAVVAIILYWLVRAVRDGINLGFS